MVVVGEADRLSGAVDAVRRTVDRFDLACSRFRDDSELTAVNRAAGGAVRVSALFTQALSAGLRAAELTDGDVDPALGSALVALGYDRDFELVAAGGRSPGRLDAPSLSFASVPGWRTIRIDRRAGTAAVAKGVSLDLGATAKALAADHAALAAAERSGCGVLVSLGGDIATAGDAPPHGWRIRVTDDHRSEVDAPGQWITIGSGGLATSSTSVRRWRAGEQTVHHLIDPSTGRPAEGGWRTVSVAAGTCLDANIASTSAIVRGRRARGWLESAGLPSRLVSDTGRVTHVAGWPADGDDLVSMTADELSA